MTFAPFLAPERDQAAKAGRPKSATTYYTIPGVTYAGSSSQGISSGTDYYSPFYVQTPIVVDQLVAEVNTLSAGNFRIGFYRADTDWQPIGAPLADSGNLDAGTTGIKTYTPTNPVLLTRGRYLSVLNGSSTPTMTASFGFPPEAHTISTLATGSCNRLWRVTRAYAAFPTPGTAWDTVTASSSVMLQMVCFRVSVP